MCDEQSVFHQEVLTESMEDFCTSSKRSDESLNLENSIEEVRIICGIFECFAQVGTYERKGSLGLETRLNCI
jgi:hypothetical protein